MLKVTSPRFLFIFWIVLAGAGVWLLAETGPAGSDPTHATGPAPGVTLEKIQNGINHMTVWYCNRNRCKNNEGEATIVRGTEEELECTTNQDCGHSNENLDGKVGAPSEWAYKGHRDRYAYNWGCPPGLNVTPGSKATEPRWGALTLSQSRPLPYPSAEPPHSYQPHCTPPPTLSVADGSAREGSNVCFDITMSNVVGTINWSTGPGTGANAAAFSGANKDLDRQSGTFAAFSGEHEVYVATVNHSRAGATKNFTLNASRPNVPNARGVGTITNSNTAPSAPTTTTAPYYYDD